ncbi:MAG: VCBS repeat-containing protein [Leifsonia sp.]|nr:VCBS repeat-containing protein [Leifsonia sp.]
MTRRSTAGLIALSAMVVAGLAVAAPAEAATVQAPSSAEVSSVAAAPPGTAPTPGTGPTADPRLAGHPHRRTCSTPKPGHAACFAEVVEGVAAPAVGQAPVGYSPSQLQQAYALPAGAGQGATVAVIDAYDLPTAESDLAAYRSRFGLPACTTANGCFRKMDQRGGASYPAIDPQRSWGPETAIDIEMVSAACPSCKILLVEADDASVTNLGQAVNTAVQFGARFVSNSYGIADAGWDFSPYDAYYDHAGVAITASTGDVGYGSEFPASSRFVTAVGGTSLSVAAGTDRGWSEAAWSGSGSGCSSYSVKPAWQTDTGCVSKTVADVSAVADPGTGVAGYGPTATAPYTSAWQVFGGTSVSAPLVAGMYALAGVPAAGTYPASYPYAHPEALNDVTQGSNGSGCAPAYLCTAAPGYDGPTGLGTPKGVSSLSAPGNAAAPTQNDFNSDAKSDVLARSATGGLFLYRGSGSGGWLSPASIQVGSGWGGMTILSPGDFDGDGRNDVVARDSAGLLWLYPGDGASGWGARRLVGSGWGGMRIMVGVNDFTGDHVPDVLAIDGSGALWLYPGDGHGAWRARSAIGSGWGGMTAVVSINDFNGDGSADLLARDSSGRLWLYAHTPSGWKAPVVVGIGWNGITAIVSPGDFDGDGHDDVLGRTAAGALVLYPGTGRSGWGSPRQIGSGWNVMNWMS